MESPIEYKFITNTLKNVPQEYVDIRANTLCDNMKAKQSKIRVGRGYASGKGKTSGKGHKGQGQRGTKQHGRYEGGQTPLYRRIPKFGGLKQNKFM